MITFTVPGDPVPQPRPRFRMQCGFPQAYTEKKHPINAYRQSIALAARAAGLTTMSKPIHVCFVFVFERPKSHMTGRGRVVKATAPPLPLPDVDNLAKGVLDALKDFFNDKMVASLQVSKSYGDVAHTKVVIA